SGIEPQTETVWRQATTYGVPRIVMINKMDNIGTDFLYATSILVDRLVANTHPLQLTIGADDECERFIDLITMKTTFYLDDIVTPDETREIPDAYKEQAKEYRNNLIEGVADHNEDNMMKYIEGEEIEEAELKNAIREATLSVDFFPVFAASAFKNKGVQSILDGVIDYLPAPTDIPPIEGILPGSEEEVVRKASDDEPFSALAFKVM